MRLYKGIDIGRIVFACLIPILHIPFHESIGIDITRQYVSRLGVPFFFAVSGMFLSQSIEKYGASEALKKYMIRVGRVLLIWLIIYSPLLIISRNHTGNFFQEVLFKTPAFLWFLSSLLVASIPFCLIRNRKTLLLCSFLLYIIGTLFSDSYHISNNLLWGTYKRIFLTTRNGIFFGLPLMIAGEMTWKTNTKNMPLFIISGVALITEITLVGIYMGDKTADRSMYFLLPVFIYALLLMLREWNPHIEGKYLGGISSAIYVMQYGIITLGTSLLRRMSLSGTTAMWLVFLAVVAVPTVFYWVLRHKRIVKIIF